MKAASHSRGAAFLWSVVGLPSAQPIESFLDVRFSAKWSAPALEMLPRFQRSDERIALAQLTGELIGCEHPFFPVDDGPDVIPNDCRHRDGQAEERQADVPDGRTAIENEAEPQIAAVIIGELVRQQWCQMPIAKRQKFITNDKPPANELDIAPTWPNFKAERARGFERHGWHLAGGCPAKLLVTTFD